jgi:ATP-binding cassette subfamily B protein
MTRDLSLPIGIVVCPIVREPDGLAMSSRNTYLNPDERRAATVLYRALQAAKAAAAHDFIMSFPQGYDTPVGERGTTLSGGQKQRIAIARALLMDPRILILDDATASVDVATEAKIQAALDHLMEGRTSFVIAQRISTVMNADLILVLEKGRIVAQGRHAELMETSPHYAEIYHSQLVDDTEA